jgi:hypothetical protein
VPVLEGFPISDVRTSTREGEAIGCSVTGLAGGELELCFPTPFGVSGSIRGLTWPADSS